MPLSKKIQVSNKVLRRFLMILGVTVSTAAAVAALVFLPRLLVTSQSELYQYSNKSLEHAQFLMELEIKHRTTIAQIIAGLAVLIGGYIAWQRMKLMEMNTKLVEQGQVTERFTRAIEQLGHDKPTIRIGGIYSLQRIVKDSKDDSETITKVLAGFVRDSVISIDHDRLLVTNQLKEENESDLLSKLPEDILTAIFALSERSSINGELTQSDLREIELKRFNLDSINLTGANLRMSNFLKSNLKNAELSHANLSRSCLAFANLSGANLSSSNLNGAWLEGANFRYADLRHTELTEADLTDVSLNGARLYGCNLSLARLIRTDISDVELFKAKLHGAKITDVRLRGVNLTCADLTEAVCVRCDFSNSNLRGADLSAAKLCGTILRHVELNGANLKNTDLREADLTGVDFSFANLSGTKLNRANLTRANLKYWGLGRENLHNYEDLFLNNLLEAKTLWKAKLSAGIRNRIHQVRPELLDKPFDSEIV